MKDKTVDEIISDEILTSNVFNNIDYILVEEVKYQYYSVVKKNISIDDIILDKHLTIKDEKLLVYNKQE